MQTPLALRKERLKKLFNGITTAEAASSAVTASNPIILDEIIMLVKQVGELERKIWPQEFTFFRSIRGRWAHFNLRPSESELDQVRMAVL